MSKYLALKGEGKFDISKFTVVGTPTITEAGVASGFSNDDYFSKTISLDSSKTFDLVFKFKTPETITTPNQVIGNSTTYPVINYRLNATRTVFCEFSISSATRHYATSSIALKENTDYYGKISYDKSAVKFYYSENGIDFNILTTLNNITDFNGIYDFANGIGRALGNVAYAYPFQGSIDLPSISITVDGKEVFTGTKPVHLLERRNKLVWDSSQFTEVGKLHVVDDYKNYLYKDNFKAQTGAGDCTAQVLNGGYIGLRGYRGYQPVLINFTGETPFRLNQLVWRNNPDQGNQGYAPTFYTLTASNDNWATSVTLGTFTASAAKDEVKTFTWDVNSTTAYKSYQMTSDGRHTNGSDGKLGLSITFISFAVNYDKDSYDKVNGVASGFSGNDYLTTQDLINIDPTNFSISFEFTTGADISTSQHIIRSSDEKNVFLILIQSSKIGLYLNDTSGVASWGIVGGSGLISTKTLMPNKKYKGHLIFDGSCYKLYLNNEVWLSVESKKLIHQSFKVKLGQGKSGATPFFGSINLKQFKIYTDNNLVFDGGADTYVYDPSKFTVVGTPTITEYGILSNCSNTNYVNTQVQLSQLAGKSWAVKGNITVGNEASVAVKFSSTGYTTLGSIMWQVSKNRVVFLCRTGIAGATSSDGDKITTPNNSFAVGDKIYYTLSFDITTGTYSLYADKINGTTLIGTWTATSDNKELYYINTQPTQYISFGRGSDGSANLTTGSVDMKDFYVEVDGKEVFSGAKESYYILRS